MGQRNDLEVIERMTERIAREGVPTRVAKKMAEDSMRRVDRQRREDRKR